MKKYKGQQGFTIVEVLVATLAFSILVISASTTFVQILNLERRGVAIQKVQENSLFVLESMARDIRVSKIENQDDLNCNLTSLVINHPVKGVITYTLNTTTGVVRKTEGGFTVDISSSDVDFDRLNFCIDGSSPADDKQVKVTVIASIKHSTGNEASRLNLQTTVSSRSTETELID